MCFRWQLGPGKSATPGIASVSGASERLPNRGAVEMAREATPLVVPDLSTFARSLGRALNTRHAASNEPLGHLHLQNLIARAAGYRNLQALKAAAARMPAPGANARLSNSARRTLMQFDRDGRLLRWPTKFSVQRLAMWLLWTRFEGRRVYTEREVNEILKAANAFGDHVTLRRELVNHHLLTRKSDCSEYRKVSARPDEEVRALLSAWRSRSSTQ
jgi:hypothetical protein